MSRRDPGPLEKVIESKVCAYAAARGFLHRKFVSPSNRASPDRLFIFDGIHFFIEFKRLGEEPTAQQKIEHAKIRAAGGVVHVIDNINSGLTLIHQYLLLT